MESVVSEEGGEAGERKLYDILCEASARDLFPLERFSFFHALFASSAKGHDFTAVCQASR